MTRWRTVAWVRPAIAAMTLLLVLAATWPVVSGQDRDAARRQRFTHNGFVEDERQPETSSAQGAKEFPFLGPTEAPAAFDNRTNGFSPQGQPFDTIDEDNVVPLRSFNDNRFIFEEAETIPDGLGPTYNAQGCRECHQNVVTGGASQIAEHRTGHMTDGQFFESQGGSLVHSRATDPAIMELVAFEDDVRTFRISTNTLGAGFIEAIANSTLQAIRDATACEPSRLAHHGARARGQQPGTFRPLRVEEPAREPRVVCGRRVSERDGHHDADSSRRKTRRAGAMSGGSTRCPIPKTMGWTWWRLPNFMRATKAPPRGPIDAQAAAGALLFDSVGCATCHVASITTARPGTAINGGRMTVGRALGNKIIHPYSDFLLHDIGTGDGIPIQPTPEFASTANQMRTAPLWALRTRNRLMHDGLSFTKQEAIARHAGQATAVRQAYDALTATQKAAVLRFLDSL